MAGRSSLRTFHFALHTLHDSELVACELKPRLTGLFGTLHFSPLTLHFFPNVGVANPFG
jgi:hypothetical protein